MKYISKKRQMKEFIVSLFYNVEFFNGSVTTLAGPQLQRVVNLANNLEPESINIYETCPKTFEKQVKDKYQYFKNQDNINLHFDDLLNAPVTEFIDADLMKTFKTDGKIIEHLFNKQRKLDAQQKVFVGTISLRKVNINDVHNWLTTLLNKVDKSIKITNNIEYKDSNGSLVYLKKIKTIYSSKIETFDLFHYSDKEGPMLTFRIIY